MICWQFLRRSGRERSCSLLLSVCEVQFFLIAIKWYSWIFCRTKASNTSVVLDLVNYGMDCFGAPRRLRCQGKLTISNGVLLGKSMQSLAIIRWAKRWSTEGSFEFEVTSDMGQSVGIYLVHLTRVWKRKIWRIKLVVSCGGLLGENSCRTIWRGWHLCFIEYKQRAYIVKTVLLTQVQFPSRPCFCLLHSSVYSDSQLVLGKGCEETDE